MSGAAVRGLRVAVASFGALVSVAQAGVLDTLYDDQQLIELQPRYERALRSNYVDIIAPVLTTEERARFANTQVRVLLRIPDREPFGFVSAAGQVVISTASLQFLFEMVLAERWLDRSGYARATVEEYLTMLRYWDEKRGRPPGPLAVLCIPPESAIDRTIVQEAEEIFSDAAFFVQLHEYGHVLYGHPGNRDVPPAQSRANEQAADSFALDVEARLNNAPSGLAWFFFVASYLTDFTVEAGTAAQRTMLAARTHPVSPERLQAVARQLAMRAEVYAKAFKSTDSATVGAYAIEINRLGYLLADPMVQRYTLLIGTTVSPADLAPRPNGRNLSPPCDGRTPSQLPYDGTLRGKLSAGGEDLKVDYVLTQRDDIVHGSFSYGKGIGRILGKITDGGLIYRWTLGSEAGQGIIT